MLSIAPPYLDHALDLPLDFPLDTPLDVATFKDILARIRTCDPLVARDSRLIDSANTGRPILQGAAMSFDGATQSITAAHLVGTETVVSSHGTSTPTVSAGSVAFTAGTCALLELSDGTLYEMQERQGSIAYDSSGAGNNGVYVGSPVSVTDNTIPVDPANERGFSTGRNFCFNSQDFEDWVSAGLAVTPNDELSPNGSLTADTVTKTPNNENDRVLQDVTTQTITEHTISTYIKNVDVTGSSAITIRTGSIMGRVLIAWSGATLTGVTNSGGTTDDISYTSEGNGWYRVSFKTTVDTLTPRIELDVDRVNGGEATSVIVWGCQLEEGDLSAYQRMGADFTPIILARSDDPSTDVLGNPAQWQGSAYPVRPVERQSNALSFDGATQYADYPADVALHVQEFSLCIWIKYSNLENSVIFEMQGNAQWSMQTDTAGGLTAVSAGLAARAITPTTYNDGEWHSVVYTTKLNGSTRDDYIYVDGVLAVSALGRAVGAINYAPTDNVTIGAREGLVAPFTGSLSNAQYYSAILTASEAVDYHLGRLSKSADLLLSSPLAEGAGSTAYNKDGTNHATLVGNPTWVREDGIPSSNLDDGFSKRMAFDGVNDIVTLGSDVTLSGDFFIEVSEQTPIAMSEVLVGDTANATWIRINSNGSITFKVGNVTTHTSGSGIYTFDGEGHTHRFERVSGIVTWYIDGGLAATLASSSSADAVFNMIGAKAGSNEWLGTIYNVNINDQASYLGTGNQDSDWLDQIGSNNGTVTGGETLRIPAAEGSNSLDAVGGTLTNPAVSDGHNDAETELDFYNIATDGGTTPAIVASGVVLTDYSFGQMLLNPMFKRTISSVLEDRHTLFAAVLTGDCLETANEYTI